MVVWFGYSSADFAVFICAIVEWTITANCAAIGGAVELHLKSELCGTNCVNTLCGECVCGGVDLLRGDSSVRTFENY